MTKIFSVSEKYGPWAVISGGSEGTGAEFARYFAAEGIHICLVARRQGPLDYLAEQLKIDFGIQVRTISLDLSQAQAAEQLVTAVADIEVGMYVSNAGTDDVMAPFLDVPIEKSLAMINMNVTALTSISFSLLRQMRKRRRGGLIVMSSVSALVGGQPNVAIYSASKSYGLSFAESLWYELHKENIDVIGIAAPPMATPVALALLSATSANTDGLYKPSEVVRIAMEKLGKVPSHVFDFVDVDVEAGEITAAKRHDRMRAVAESITNIYGMK